MKYDFRKLLCALNDILITLGVASLVTYILVLKGLMCATSLCNKSFVIRFSQKYEAVILKNCYIVVCSITILSSINSAILKHISYIKLIYLCFNSLLKWINTILDILNMRSCHNRYWFTRPSTYDIFFDMCPFQWITTLYIESDNVSHTKHI